MIPGVLRAKTRTGQRPSLHHRSRMFMTRSSTIDPSDPVETGGPTILRQYDHPISKIRLNVSQAREASAGEASASSVYKAVLHLLYFGSLCFTFSLMTTTISSRGQTVVPAEIRARHHLTEKSRLTWVDDGDTIRVIPLSANNPFGRGIAKDLDLSHALRTDRAKERERERRGHRP